MKRASVTVVVLGALLSAGCATQAPAPCQIQSAANGGYAVRLLRTGAASAGCDTPAGTPAQIGDLWVFDAYESGASGVTIIGFSSNIGTPDPVVTTDKRFGRAEFTAKDPGADNNCTLNNMTFDGGAAGKYAISNFIWLSTALYLGTEFKADVTYTAGTCTATYSAQAITPPVQCATNADCDPFAQPFSSGINPDYDQGCKIDTWSTQISGDAATGICFFNKDYPSLGGFTK